MLFKLAATSQKLSLHKTRIYKCFARAERVCIDVDVD